MIEGGATPLSSEHSGLMLADEAILKLRELQYDGRGRYLLFTQDPVGLGGQISRRILGLRLALHLNRQVVFPSIAEPPYGQVFKPLHSDVDYQEMAASSVDYRAPEAKSASIVRMNFWDFWADRTLSSAIYSTFPKELSAAKHPNLAYDGMLLSFCSLLDEHRVDIAEAIAKFGVDEMTLGVHIRRGDKSVETPLVPLSTINGSIEKLCRTHRIEKIFAASDDPDVFDKLHIPKGISLIYDREERRYNNANHKHLRKNCNLVAQETSTAIRNIYLLGNCGKILGQNNAHFATLSAAQIAFRTGNSYGELIEGDIATQQSLMTRLTHRTKVVIRRLARGMVPWATIRKSGGGIS